MHTYSKEQLPPTDLTPDEWKMVPKGTRLVVYTKLGELLVGNSPDPLSGQGVMIAALRRIIACAPPGFKGVSNPYIADQLHRYSETMVQRDQPTEGVLLEGLSKALWNITKPRRHP